MAGLGSNEFNAAGRKCNRDLTQLPGKLETSTDNFAEVFSVGQKQLLCLARALLRKNKILILDEATANVDMQTDNFIQECIKAQFSGAAIITIAHRLNTIADYHKVLVVSKGRVIESGSPYELIQAGGEFAEMVANTGQNAEAIRRKAKESMRRHQSADD